MALSVLRALSDVRSWGCYLAYLAYLALYPVIPVYRLLREWYLYP